MEVNNFKTKVIFRKFKDNGAIIALFPEVINYPDYYCESYMHVGQHGAADYVHCIEITTPASYQEYKALAKELRGLGYELNIKQKHVRKRKKVAYV